MCAEKIKSIYHILDQVPAFQEDTPKEYELLARALMASGKIRIDTDYYCNFARFTDTKVNINWAISKEELYDKKLLPQTLNRFTSFYQKHYPAANVEARLEKTISDLKNQVNKLLLPSDVLVLQLARLFVQSAHPIVIKWLLHDKVEVYITYSHNIGDMMDIQSWRISGTNSGMQSTDGKEAAIFVSCGGDPFGETSKITPTHGDGWPAVARLQIITAQELGHFADIKRDASGKQITRHSANFAVTQPTPHVKIARISDVKNSNNILNELMMNGLKILIKNEEELKFFNANKIKGLRYLKAKILCYYFRKKLVNFAIKKKLFFVKKLSRDQYLGLMVRAMIYDMKFNLTPVADVYRNDNKDIEEAIACAEALARVPQQAVKWGHLVTYTFMKDLYKIYYLEVIPSLINNYELMTGEVHKSFDNSKTSSLYSRFKSFFKKQDRALVAVRNI